MDDPSQTSSEYNSMSLEWELIADIMAGVKAMRRKGTRYLPQFQNESGAEYKRRLDSAPWRPEFTDVLQTLASKPFGKDVIVKGVAPERIAGKLDPATGNRTTGFVDDVDGRGNSLTIFARETFLQAVAKGAHAIMVDYPRMPEGASRADEVRLGARPYWLQIPIENILALYTENVGGRETIVHVRIRENTTERDGYGEKVVERVRVYEPGMWTLWERQPNATWTVAEEGSYVRGGKHDSVPLVLFFTGQRMGMQAVRPPLADLADLQVELYNALSRQEEVLTYASSPMLAANGIAAPTKGEKLEVGPKTILFAPPVGDNVRTSFEYIQPAAANITEIRHQVEAIQRDMRRIGLQPLTEQPGNATATGQSIAAAKAHSQVKAWALMLNDAIEQALKLTSECMGLPDTIETEISTDFSVLPYAQFPLQALTTARENRDISRKAFLDSLKRFDVLPADFDDAADAVVIKAEGNEPPVTDDITLNVESDTRPRAVRRREARKVR